MRKRKIYDDNFKARLALEAVKGERTISEISSQFEVHPNQIIKWKKQLLENVPSLFSQKKDPEIAELKKLMEELYKKDWAAEYRAGISKNKVQANPEHVKKEVVEKEHQELSVRRQCATQTREPSSPAKNLSQYSDRKR